MVDAVRKICQQRCQETLWKNQFSLVGEHREHKEMEIKKVFFSSFTLWGISMKFINHKDINLVKQKL